MATEQALVPAHRSFHPRRILIGVLVVVVIGAAATLAGWDIAGWFKEILTAYDVPVSFHTLMRVVAGNSIANVSSVTPGGAGVVQGFNVLSLKGVTSTANATAYSVSQQLVTTAWGILFAILLLIRAFGWTDGKTLVAQSYSQAREKNAEHSAKRKAARLGKAS
jgi:pyruvate carboxylase